MRSALLGCTEPEATPGSRFPTPAARYLLLRRAAVEPAPSGPSLFVTGRSLPLSALTPRCLPGAVGGGVDERPRELADDGQAVRVGGERVGALSGAG
jgi:hypothetical protein